MSKNKEQKLWVTVLYLVLGALVIIGLVGLALWWAEKADMGNPIKAPSDTWGIANDSPLRMRR